MPDLMDRLYCSEQIHIPPTFPFIMKLYCKAAIRTQPYDLLKWSAAYFRALANGEEPPVKDRIEYPPYDSPTGLTPGYLKMLIKQLGKDPDTVVSAQTIFIKWNCVCLEDELLIKILALMGAATRFNWLKFVAVASGYICSTLTNTMILICELLTDEPEGGMATIPSDVFDDLYGYLAGMECGPLTEEELKQIEEMEIDEDVAAIAEKIRTAIYVEEEGEGAEGRFAPQEMPEMEGEIELVGEQSMMNESKDSIVDIREKVESTVVEDVDSKEDGEDEEKGEEGELGSDETDISREKIRGSESKQTFRDDDAGSEEAGDELLHKELGSASQEGTSVENEEVLKEEAFADMEEKPAAAEEKDAEKAEGADEGTEKEKKVRKIKLEDFEESIRIKIEEKLAADEVSERSDEGFEELGSYLLDAAARVRKYTAEEIGYRIFKKYMRQEVPGIGPRIDKAEIEKVFDFMDYNSHKQEGMVMPRNIRHWLCPPLDKVPLPEP